MNKSESVGAWSLLRAFLWIGASSFGGWATTAVLIEKEFVQRRKLLAAEHLQGSVTYALALPGATQVSLVALAGYRLHGGLGAIVSTVGYLLPAVSLIVLFSVAYFSLAQDVSQLPEQLDGLVAALAGIILASAYKIGRKFTGTLLLWLLVGAAFIAALLGVNALVLLVVFGLGGLVWSWSRRGKEQEWQAIYLSCLPRHY